jgi:Kef-type K+ transport system membrane component KefB
LTPFFFGFIGLQVDLRVAGSVAGLAIIVTLVALATKVVGCGLGAYALGRKSALAVGVGMMPRGEVGIIVALIGLSLHVIPETLYAVVVAMSLLTTLVTPPLLVWAFRRLPSPGHDPASDVVAKHL